MDIKVTVIILLLGVLIMLGVEFWRTIDELKENYKNKELKETARNIEDEIMQGLIVTIIYGDYSQSNYVDFEHIKATKYYLHEEQTLTLKEIAAKYPNVIMVIAESGLRGTVYRYENHKAGTWEEVGKTQGYA